MALWQLRLGERGQEQPDWREAFLAQTHSLISIDYGIKKDIRNMADDEIRKHVEEIQYNNNSRAIGQYMRQILDFKNRIRKGDFVISPFNYLEGGKKFRIGKFIGKMGTLESLFGENLASYLSDHAYSPYLQRYLTIDECRNLPTHQVEWLTEVFPKSDLNTEVKSKLSAGAGRATVAKLNFYGELPNGLAPKKFFLTDDSVNHKKNNEGSEQRNSINISIKIFLVENYFEENSKKETKQDDDKNKRYSLGNSIATWISAITGIFALLGKYFS